MDVKTRARAWCAIDARLRAALTWPGSSEPGGSCGGSDALPGLGAARVVAGYVPVGSEPGPRDLPEVLATGGGPVRTVLLPVLMADNDLDWAYYRGPGSLVSAARGLREPTGRCLGPRAVVEADVVLVPGLAVDRGGMRLGRGGGSYDRALARLRPGALTVVLLYDDEVLDDAVPAEPHDLPVDAALTPSGWVRFGHVEPHPGDGGGGSG